MAALSNEQFRAALLIAPAVCSGIIFELFLGHRHDYAGHFLAGYGGTLGAFMFCFRLLPSDRFDQRAMQMNLPLTIGCILLGAVAEASIFRIAKFDEVDFCNQSLGAVLAAVASLAFCIAPKPVLRQFDFGLIVGIAFLGAGGCFAVA